PPAAQTTPAPTPTPMPTPATSDDSAFRRPGDGVTAPAASVLPATPAKADDAEEEGMEWANMPPAQPRGLTPTPRPTTTTAVPRPVINAFDDDDEDDDEEIGTSVGERQSRL